MPDGWKLLMDANIVKSEDSSTLKPKLYIYIYIYVYIYIYCVHFLRLYERKTTPTNSQRCKKHKQHCSAS